MRISVAMATYNGERFLREQLESLARQTLPPSELVVGDDGSTDRTLDIVAEFARSAPFPVLVHRNEANLGYTSNFLQTAARCSGDLVAFCDQDDIWLPHKLERCARAFSDQEVVLLVHSAEVIDGAGRRLGRRLPAIKRSGKRAGHETPPLGLREPPGFAAVVRKGVFQDFWRAWPGGLYRCLAERCGNLLGHDRLLFWAARDRGHIYYDSQALVLYRVHGGNTSAPRGAFGSTSERLRYALAQSARATGADYRRIAEKHRAECVLLAALSAHGGLRSLERIQRVWEAAGRNFALRAELYEREGWPFWSRYLRMVALRCYASRAKGGLGVRSAVKDAVRGCLMALGMRPIERGQVVSVGRE